MPTTLYFGKGGAMTADDIRIDIERLHEESLVREFPDPKRRAVARWYFALRSKAITHKLVTGRDATVDDLLETPDRGPDHE